MSASEQIDDKYYKSLLSAGNSCTSYASCKTCGCVGAASEVYSIEYEEDFKPPYTVPVGFARPAILSVDPKAYKYYM